MAMFSSSVTSRPSNLCCGHSGCRHSSGLRPRGRTSTVAMITLGRRSRPSAIHTLEYYWVDYCHYLGHWPQKLSSLRNLCCILSSLRTATWCHVVLVLHSYLLEYSIAIVLVLKLLTLMINSQAALIVQCTGQENLNLRWLLRPWRPWSLVPDQSNWINFWLFYNFFFKPTIE